MPENRFSLRFLREMKRNPLRALSEATAQDSPMSRLESGPFRCHVITDPDVAAKALTGSGHTYRRTPDLAFWFPPAGEGVASSPHDKWLRQRRLLAPYFKASTEKRLTEITATEADRLIDRLSAVAGTGEVELQALVMETTLRIAVQHLLLRPFPVESAPISAAIQTAMHYATPGRAIKYRILGPLNRKLAKRALHPRPKREALQVLEDFVDKLIALARAHPESRAPLMSALLEADTNGELDPGELRDHVATFLVAAVDSVGSSIIWTLWQLAQQPDHAQRAGSSKVWAEASVLESMRITPPLWIYWREVNEDHELAGVSIRKKDLVVFVPYVIHMRPEIWESPTEFRPERFVQNDRIAGETGYRYMPFGHGGHACLGRRMAMTESREVVHRISERFKLQLAPRTARQGSDAEEVRVAVLVKDGMWAHISER
ncbi:MAG: cytochrome P450 [Rhodothermales bacterium]